MIERGDYREPVFWLVATYARCQKVLAHDAPPAMHTRFDDGFQRLPRDLGIASAADLRWRADEARATLPRGWETATAIIAANPGVKDA